jgi:CMP/dCMP kinase
MKITITGNGGAGKTTVGKIIAEKLGYNFYSIGDLRGKIALEKNMTIDDLNKIGEREDWTDKNIDEYQAELGEKEDNFVMEGRLSWYFIPNSIKIFLSVNETEGARRILLDPREDERKIESLEEMVHSMVQRRASDIKRYKKYYRVDPYNMSNYDIHLDTTDKNIETVIDILMKNIIRRKEADQLK